MKNVVAAIHFLAKAPAQPPRPPVEWVRYYDETLALWNQHDFLKLVHGKGFSPVKISWEDIGRHANSVWGDRISDVGIWVRKLENDGRGECRRRRDGRGRPEGGEEVRGRPEYNWQYIDELYDFLLRIDMKPFVELGFAPNALASGSKTIFWWKGNVTPPKDAKKWGDLIRALVAHFKERYGEDEVRTWYFEVWNEPNLEGFFAGTQQDHFKLYATTARAIESVSPAFRVGGPATAGCSAC